MKTIYTICCGACMSSCRFDTIEDADKAAREMSNMTGRFWYVRPLLIREGA